MKQESADDGESLVIVAQVVKTRGLKGEVVAELLTDFPHRFDALRSLIALSPTGERQLVELENYWLHQDRIVLKFAGYDTIEAASTFINYQLAVPEDQQVALDEGYFYDWQLEGCAVETLLGDSVGKVAGVLRLGGGIEMLAVDDEANQRRLIPMVEAIVIDIDVAEKRIRIDPPEGLLEL